MPLAVDAGSSSTAPASRSTTKSASRSARPRRGRTAPIARSSTRGAQGASLEWQLRLKAASFLGLAAATGRGATSLTCALAAPSSGQPDGHERPDSEQQRTRWCCRAGDPGRRWRAAGRSAVTPARAAGPEFSASFVTRLYNPSGRRRTQPGPGRGLRVLLVCASSRSPLRKPARRQDQRPGPAAAILHGRHRSSATLGSHESARGESAGRLSPPAP